VARAAAQPKYAPPRATRTRIPFSSAGRRASDGLSPLRAEGPREKVALCAKNGCKAQAKATQRTTWARQGYAALQQAVSGSCSAHRRRSVTGPLRERKQQCTRNTEKAVVKKRRGDQAPPANQERAKKLGMNSSEEKDVLHWLKKRGSLEGVRERWFLKKNKMTQHVFPKSGSEGERHLYKYSHT